MKLLTELITTTSPSTKEHAVRAIILREIDAIGHEAVVDTLGNVEVVVGSSKTLFLSHMDCVHNDHPITVEVCAKGIMSLTKDCKQKALGADDKAGVVAMLHMIENDIPGNYVFMVQEENGCQGSTHYAKGVGSHIKNAISFDRKGTNAIITEMAYGTCVSDDFTKSLMDEMNKHSLGYWYEDPTGTITDSLSFEHMIMNYTNISVGYENEHSQQETLDTQYLFEVLLPTLLKVNWEELSHTEKPVSASWEYDWVPGNDIVNDHHFSSVRGTDEEAIDGLFSYFNSHQDETFTGSQVLDIIDSLEQGYELNRPAVAG